MQGSGLTATELAMLLSELEVVLADASVRDVARLADKDDLLLFLDGAKTPRALHIVTGGPRARITCTRRRFRKTEFTTGPLIDRLRSSLVGATFRGCSQAEDERRCSLLLTAETGSAMSLEIELFGARGLWCLVDDGGRIQELSRLPKSAGRDLRPGADYLPPPPRTTPSADPPPRFATPLLDSVDDWFTERDRNAEVQQLRSRLEQTLARAIRKLQNKIEGLTRQQQEIGRIDEIRTQADMLLAYGFALPPGADTLTVPHPEDPERSLTYPIDKGVPIQNQANKLYQRARKLQDGAAMAERRKAEAATELGKLHECTAELEACEGLDDLRELHARLVDHGLMPVPRNANARRSTPTGPTAKQRQLAKITKGHNFRNFRSVEGHLILVGRTNQQNDRLSISVARGNDLWFHVGRGYAGSHVVMRLPTGKTASLSSMLDAGTLAIHFSKARNAHRCDVIYTLAKNVRKPKGLPPGRVTTGNTKTLTVDLCRDRLQRLLDSAGDDPE